MPDSRQEYKPQIKVISDPKGYLLIAMLAAQAKNKGLNLPIYGMYNIGQNCFFVVLESKEYSVSKQSDSTDPKRPQANYPPYATIRQSPY